MNGEPGTTTVLLASGTRGDVQPYIVLASRMRARGVDAIVATHTCFRPLVERAGLAYRPLADNLSDWLAEHPGALTLRAPRTSLRFWRAAQPMLTRLMDSALAAAHGATTLIAGLPTLWADSIAELTGAKLAWAFLQPVTPTAAFASSLWPFDGAPWLSYAVIDRITWLPWRATVNHWRRAHGLPELGSTGLLSRIHASDAPIHYGFSERLVPRPADWPERVRIDDFWLPDRAAAPLNPVVQAFVDANPSRTIYIGTGRGGALSGRALLRIADDALAALNLRAVVNIPGARAQSPRMLHVDDVAHAALFPQMRAIVHHGGAGTTGEALRAGVRSVVLPVFADQHFWARRLRMIGMAGATLDQRRLTDAALANALREVIA